MKKKNRKLKERSRRTEKTAEEKQKNRKIQRAKVQGKLKDQRETICQEQFEDKTKYSIKVVVQDG